MNREFVASNALRRAAGVIQQAFELLDPSESDYAFFVQLSTRLIEEDTRSDNFFESTESPSVYEFMTICENMHNWQSVALVVETFVALQPAQAHGILNCFGEGFTPRSGFPFNTGNVVPSGVMGFLYGAIRGARWLDTNWKRETKYTKVFLPKLLADVIVFQCENPEAFDAFFEQETEFAGEFSNQIKGYARGIVESNADENKRLNPVESIKGARMAQVQKPLIETLQRLSSIETHSIKFKFSRFGLELFNQLSYAIFGGCSEQGWARALKPFDPDTTDLITKKEAYAAYGKLTARQRAWAVLHIFNDIMGLDRDILNIGTTPPKTYQTGPLGEHRDLWDI